MHGIIKTHPLTEGLEQLKRFLRNSQDIVYIIYGGFEQFWPDEAHGELIELLYSHLAEWWVLPTINQFDVTLNELWNLPYLNPGEGRLISSYEVCQQTADSCFF